jgi:hypothetical protein
MQCEISVFLFMSISARNCRAILAIIEQHVDELTAEKVGQCSEFVCSSRQREWSLELYYSNNLCLNNQQQQQGRGSGGGELGQCLRSTLSHRYGTTLLWPASVARIRKFSYESLRLPSRCKGIDETQTFRRG